MATNQSNIKVTVVGDANQFNREMHSAQSSLKDVEGQIARMNKGFKAIKWAAIGGAAALALGKMAKGLNDVTKAALSDRKEQAALNKVLQNTPGVTNKAIKANEKWIDSMELATHVSDTQLRSAVGRLVAQTGNLRKAQRLAALASDVARGRGISYTKALKQVETAYKTTTKQAKAGKETVDDLAKSYSGAAIAAAETDPYETLMVAWGQIQEQLGQVLLPLLDKFSEWFGKPENKQKLTDFITRVGEIATALGTKLADALENIDWKSLLDNLKLLADKLKTGWEWVKKLYSVFDDLSPEAKNNILGVLALFAAWKAASRVPGLKMVVSLAESAIAGMAKAAWSKIFGSKLATASMDVAVAGLTEVRGNIVNVYGPTGGTTTTPKGKGAVPPAVGGAAGAQAIQDARIAKLEASLAKNAAKDIAQSGKLDILQSATIDLRGADIAIKESIATSMAQTNAKFAEFSTEMAGIRASTAANAADIGKVNSNLAGIGDDISELTEAGKGKKVFGRLLSHVPLLGDLLVVGSSLIDLVRIYGKDGTHAFTDTDAGVAFHGYAMGAQQYTDTAVAEGYGAVTNSMKAADAKLKKDAADALATEQELRRRGILGVDGKATNAQREAERANERLDRVANALALQKLSNDRRDAGFAPMSYPSINPLADPTTTSTGYKTTRGNGNNVTVQINNQYPEPERASDNLAMSLRIARYTLEGV